MSRPVTTAQPDYHPGLLGRDEWWLAARDTLDGLSEAEVASYRTESRRLGAAAADGLDDR